MTHSLSLVLLLTSLLLFLLSPSSLSPYSLLPTSSSLSSTFSLFFCVSLWSLPPLSPLTSFLLSYSLLLMCSFLNLFLSLLHILCMSICVNNIFVLRTIDHPEGQSQQLTDWCKKASSHAMSSSCCRLDS